MSLKKRGRSPSLTSVSLSHFKLPFKKYRNAHDTSSLLDSTLVSEKSHFLASPCDTSTVNGMEHTTRRRAVDDFFVAYRLGAALGLVLLGAMCYPFLTIADGDPRHPTMMLIPSTSRYQQAYSLFNDDVLTGSLGELRDVVAAVLGITKTDARLVELETYAKRCEFTIRYQIFSIVCLLFCCFHVANQRERLIGVPNPVWKPLADSAADERRTSTPLGNVSSGASRLRVARGLMQNTLEQLVLSVANQLIAVSYLSPASTLKVIPLTVLTFVTGRVAFALGYPGPWRSVGTVLGGLPTLALTIFNLIAFFTYP